MTEDHSSKIVETLPLIKQIAWNMAKGLPSSVEANDLVQYGVIGLIDALSRFDESRGIKLKTFAAKRIRGAMMDGMRHDAWPRSIRKQRRRLLEAEESLRAELGEGPSYAELAARLGWKKGIRRTIWRIRAMESIAGLNGETAMLPDEVVPPQPESPEKIYERKETQKRLRNVIATLSRQERIVVHLYYFEDATFKQIGQVLGVVESKVRQLHTKAINKIRIKLLDS